MAVIVKDVGYMALPIQIKRTNPFPIDKYSLYYSYADMEDYARNSGLSYVGQILSLVNEDEGTAKAYLIVNAAGDLEEIGVGVAAGPSIETDGLSLEITNDKIQLKNYGKEYYKFIPATDTEDSKYELTQGWVDGLEPKVKLIGSDYILAWYEPNTETADGLASTVATLQTSVNDLADKVSGLTGAFRVIGEVADEEALNALDTSSLKNGDVYQVLSDGSEWVWTENGWMELGTNVDLSGYVTQEKLTETLGGYATTAQFTSVSNGLNGLTGRMTAVESVLNDETTGLVKRVGELETKHNNLQNVVNGLKPNVIESISVGGLKLTVDSDKNVELPTFNGATSGLVPVSTSASTLYLNSKGQWSDPVGELKIGEQSYEGNVAEFVFAAIEAEKLTWLPIE